MTTYLLDASVLIPISTRQHLHHSRALSWAGSVDSLALCPVVEGALVRYAVRTGATIEVAQDSLRVWKARPGVEFWPGDLSYADADLSQVRGHRQVTDAYLVGLAASRNGRLATLDEALAAAYPRHTTLLPSASA